MFRHSRGAPQVKAVLTSEPGPAEPSPLVTSQYGNPIRNTGPFPWDVTTMVPSEADSRRHRHSPNGNERESFQSAA